MALTPGLEIPFGIQPVNPVPVDTWSGPYYGPNETAAKAAANAAIPQAIRFQSLQVRLIIAGVPYIYWYDTGTTDTDLHIFSTGGGGTSGYSGYSGVSGWSGISGYSGFNANNQSVTYTNSFSAGQAIYKTTGGYDLALANDINTSEVIGVVQSANSSEFTYVINGYISGLTDIEDATCYYLSDTVPGQITTDAPTASGSVIKPVLIGTGTTTGVVVEFPGVIIGSTNNGTSGYLARWTGAHSLGNSSIFDSGPDVIIDATTTINGDFNILGTYLLSGVPVFDGVSGVSGYSGYSGTNGTNGISGMSGKSGYSGWSGYSGSGVSGYSGYSGISGFSGFSGYSGINGIIGVNGTSGYSGISGYSGYSGIDSLGFNYRGQYDNTQTYSINDIVTNGQNLYVALASSTNPGIVLTNTAVWNKSVTGTSGYSGWSGISGFSGLGFSGKSGYSGYSGTNGTNGASGYSGISGYSGTAGASGISGYSGAAGTGSGSINYSDVIVVSTKADNYWTAYTLTGNVEGLYSNSPLTLSSQTVYGKQFSSGTKTLIVNDGPIHTNSTYGIVVEFPSSPNVGDVISAPCVTITNIVSAGYFVPGTVYTIVTPGDTNWSSVGASQNYSGFTFTATSAGTWDPGAGTASTPAGVAYLIFKPASGQVAVLQFQGGGQVYPFGQGASYIAAYVPLGGQFGAQPITWVYAGVMGGVPTWYQMYF